MFLLRLCGVLLHCAWSKYSSNSVLANLVTSFAGGQFKQLPSHSAWTCVYPPLAVPFYAVCRETGLLPKDGCRAAFCLELSCLFTLTACLFNLWCRWAERWMQRIFDSPVQDCDQRCRSLHLVSAGHFPGFSFPPIQLQAWTEHIKTCEQLAHLAGRCLESCVAVLLALGHASDAGNAQTSPLQKTKRRVDELA